MVLVCGVATCSENEYNSCGNDATTRCSIPIRDEATLMIFSFHSSHSLRVGLRYRHVPRHSGDEGGDLRKKDFAFIFTERAAKKEVREQVNRADHDITQKW